MRFFSRKGWQTVNDDRFPTDPMNEQVITLDCDGCLVKFKYCNPDLRGFGWYITHEDQS